MITNTPDLETGLPQQQHFIELDWRELEPYFTQLQECASFWIFINLVGDMVYSGIIVLTLFLKSNLDSPFFQGMHSHINPVLMYFILSLLVNYGALRANLFRYEKCFLALSIVKTLLFMMTLGPFLYLILSDVQDYFGDFWKSFVIILGCYNGTSALSLWSMFIFNKFIYINDSAQMKQRLLNLNLYNLEQEQEKSVCFCDKCRMQRSSFINPSFEKGPVWTVFKIPDEITEGEDNESSCSSGNMDWLDFEGLSWGSIDDISNFKISL